MKTKVLSIFESKSLDFAREILLNGNLVAFPTDTVYGLGAMAFNAKGVNRIYKVKGRAAEKAIPILIGNVAQLDQVAAKVGASERILAHHFWPGPLTIILPRHTSIPDAVTSLPTVGVRIPNLASALELLNLTGPMAVSSANLSGQTSCSTAGGVLSQLDGKIPLILDGGVTPGGTPSTIVDCNSEKPVVIREGPISLAQILQTLSQARS